MDLLLIPFTQKDAEEAWRFLDNAIDLIAIKEIKNLSFQDLYNSAYKLVINKYGLQLYERLKEKLLLVFNTLIQKIQNLHRDLFLKGLVTVWQDANFITQLMNDIFLYMDKNWIPKEKNKKNIKSLCLEILKKLIFEDNIELSQRILIIIMEQIKQDRDCQVIERSVLKSAIQIMVFKINKKKKKKLDIDVICTPVQTYSTQYTGFQYVQNDKFYRSFFEIRLIKETQKYYNEISQKMIKILSISDYFKFCKERLSKELERVSAYLQPCSGKQIQDALVQFMITNQAVWCLKMENKGVLYFLETGQIKNLSEAYNLYLLSSQSFELFIDGISKYIINKGSQILQDRKSSKLEDNNLILDQLIEFYELFEDYQANCFNQGQKNQQAQLTHTIRGKTNYAFEQVVNQDSFLTSTLNKNLDSCFKKEFRSLSSEEAEKKLRRNFCIFRLIKQKDIFENHYRHLLAKRLIEGTSISDELEKYFLTHMKRECGSSFTGRAETMFKDMEISKLDLAEFKKTTRQTAHNEKRPLLAAIDLEFYVLTMGQWPLQDPLSLVLAEELKFWKQSFEKSYYLKNKQRKLTWYHNLGFVDLKAHYSQGKKKEFITSTVQACALLLFNSDETLEVQQFVQKLEVPLEILKKELNPLILSNVLVVKKQSGQQNNIDEINAQDQIKRNPEFNHKNYKLKFLATENKLKIQQNSSSVSLKQQIQSVSDILMIEEEELKNEVIVERKFVLESIVVRIMKARKEMDHQKLVEQIIEQAQQRHFVPDQQSIKKAIESLMSRDYLDRKDGDKNFYIYKA